MFALSGLMLCFLAPRSGAAMPSLPTSSRCVPAYLSLSSTMPTCWPGASHRNGPAPASSEEGVGQVPASLDDARVVGPDDVEELDQVDPSGGAVVAGGTPDGVDE